MTGIRRRAGGERRAVTLIEVLVVLALLGGMLALALPIAMRSIERNTFRGAVASAVASLDEARAHAQREGVMVEVVVEGAGHRLRARALSLDGGDPTPISMIDAMLDVPITMATESGDGLMALFLPDGSSPFSRAGTLRSADGTEAVISIGAHLGRATVAERVVDAETGMSAMDEDEFPTETPPAATVPAEPPPSAGAASGRAPAGTASPGRASTP